MDSTDKKVKFAIGLHNLLVDHSHYTVGLLTFGGRNGDAKIRLFDHAVGESYDLIIKETP